MKAKITYISEKSKGIKLDNKEQWYNPTNAIKATIDKSMEGKEAEIELMEDGKTISKITVYSTSVSAEQPKQKDDYWKEKEERDIEKDRQIGRRSSLNTALEMMKLDNSVKGSADTSFSSFEEMFNNITEIAEKINKWVAKK